MLSFRNSIERIQYSLSYHEVLPPFGPVLAYEHATGTFWAPTSSGQGPTHWRQLSGPVSQRAIPVVATLLTDEVVPDGKEEIVLNGDDRYIVDDIDVQGVITIRDGGQITFVQNPGDFVEQQRTTYVYGSLTIDAEVTLDGELTFLLSLADSVDVPLMRQEIPQGMNLIIPTGYQADYEGVLKIDGQLTVDGELV